MLIRSFASGAHAIWLADIRGTSTNGKDLHSHLRGGRYTAPFSLPCSLPPTTNPCPALPPNDFCHHVEDSVKSSTLA